MKTALVLTSLLAGASAFVPNVLPTTKHQTVARGPMMAVEKSKALPFLPRPDNLDGTLAGDNGECTTLIIYRTWV